MMIDHQTVQVPVRRRRGWMQFDPTPYVPRAFLEELEALLSKSGIVTTQSRRAIPPVCSSDGDGDRESGAVESPKMDRVVIYIEENLQHPLSLDRLAEEAELSKYHFSRVFRREIGQTPWSYVRDARVRRAKSLLEQGETPATAAFEAGFCDQSHLTNVMRDAEGTTPKQYQQERLGERDRRGAGEHVGNKKCRGRDNEDVRQAADHTG